MKCDEMAETLEDLELRSFITRNFPELKFCRRAESE